MKKPRDPVEARLAAIGKQGTWLARAGHWCAVALIVLFSFGSLVALAGDALVRVVTLGLNPATIPPAITLGVSWLVVVAMDVAMIIAANTLRTLNTRRALPEEKRVHVWVMAVVALLESATYTYMSAKYEHPADAFAWGLIVLRAAMAPVLSIYLSMARPLPVGPRDILYQAELAAGAGMIRDVIQAAHNPDAPLVEKMALFGASAQMADADRDRLQTMIEVLSRAGGGNAGHALPAPDDIVEGTATVRDVTADPPTAPDDSRRGARGGSRGTPPTQKAPGSRPLRLVAPRNDTRTFDDLRAMGFGLLDVKPTMTQTALRDLLGCRNDTARSILAAWRMQRGTARGADDREDSGNVEREA